MKTKNWSKNLTAEAHQALIEVGRLIQVARRRRKMTAIEFGKRVGVDRRTISQLEAGAPTVSLGTFIQALSTLDLSRGLEVALQPETDVEAIIQEVRKIRRGKQRGRKEISDDEVNF